MPQTMFGDTSIEIGKTMFGDTAEEPVPVDQNLGVMPFVNKSIAEALGAPADIIGAGISLIPGVDIKRPFAGSERIKEDMGSIGIRLPAGDREPSTLPEFIGSGIGEVSSYMIPIGATVSKVAKGVGIAGRVASSIYKSMIKHPWLAGISEIGGGVGTGTGRKIAEEVAPGSPMARGALEMAGGFIGGVSPSLLANTPTMMAIRAGKSVLKKISVPFTEKGARYRAGEFLKSKVADPSESARVLSEETIGDLPPAVALGEKRIQELYKGLIGQDPVSDADSIERISRSIISLEKEMRKLGYGSPEILSEITAKRVAAIEMSMDTRVVKAMDSAQTKLDAIPAAKRQTEESKIVREELEGVARKVKYEVDGLWKMVPKETTVPVSKTRAKYESLVGELSKAEMVDIPPPLRTNFIVAKKDPVETTVREMQGLRSNLLELYRISRKDGKWNRARIADNMADSILEDLSTTSVSEELNAALAGTRNYKSLFESGIVGKIRGHDKTGAPAIDPSLTLRISLGREGAQGAVDLNKVVVTPEASSATKRYLSRSYSDYALDDSGLISPIKSERWIKNNEDILDQFPGLRAQMVDAAQSQRLASRTKAVMEARKKAIQDPKISTAARIINAADLNTEIGSILKSDNSIRLVKDMVAKAGKDTSGDAMRGLRAGFVEHILDKSTRGSYNEVGEQTLSGSTLLGFVKNNAPVLNQVFTPNQISRMRQIGAELARIEKLGVLKTGATDIQLEDAASSMVQLVSRVSGAQVGRAVAKLTGGGTVQTPGIFSERFRAFTHGLNVHRANQLVIDAVVSDDPKLLQALLLPLNKPTTQAENLLIFNQLMNAWLVGPGLRVLEDIAQDENEDKLPK